MRTWDEFLTEKKLSYEERKDLPDKSFIFPADSTSVKDDKDHFPIPDEAHARNALARANQYSSAPSWYTGSLESLVDRVSSAVKKKFPGIDVSEKSEKPGKG